MVEKVVGFGYFLHVGTIKLIYTNGQNEQKERLIKYECGKGRQESGP